MRSRLVLGVAALLSLCATVAKAETVYTYTAPMAFNNSSTLTIEFATAAPLAPSTQYTALPVDTLSSSLTVSSAYAVGNFTQPFQIFEVNTNSAGAISAWDIWSDASTAVGIPPTMA